MSRHPWPLLARLAGATPARLGQVALVGAGLLGGGCFDISGGGVVSPSPTLISFSPDELPPALTCGPGGLQRYVVTLRESSLVTDGSPPSFSLPSSPPTVCTRGVSFAFVVPGARYVAEVQGYDREDLVPLAPGSAVMLDPAGQPVVPRWVTECGGEGAFARDQLNVPVRGCQPWGEDIADGGADAQADAPEAGADAEPDAPDAGADAPLDATEAGTDAADAADAAEEGGDASDGGADGGDGSTGSDASEAGADADADATDAAEAGTDAPPGDATPGGDAADAPAG